MLYKLINTHVNIASEEEYINEIFNTLKNKQKKVFFYLNSYSFYLFNTNKNFNSAFKIADFIIADGYSIVKAIKILTKQEIKKVVFTYVYEKLLGKLLGEKKIKIFFLGGSNKSLKKFIDNTRLTFPNMEIVGFNDGYFNLKKQTEKIIKNINNAKTEVLIVGMGMPRSEVWLEENLNKIDVNCIISVGGFFEFLAGNKQQAPGFLYNSGFEWVYRLVQEPKRLFGRYFKANTYFLYRIIKFLIIKR
ncbi:MAG TPA: WecB/TagA/CpsF family glycosyltransferase [Melioribacteraceae bacterium]|nr:WecB/TagA/CpsF family glycosyltransferase [Melioribacteraceae bacterium]